MQFMACPTPTLTGNRSASWTHLSYNIHRAVEQWPARKAHNLEVVGSNPASATNEISECEETFLCVNSEECSKNRRVCANTFQHNSGNYSIDNQRVNRCD